MIALIWFLIGAGVVLLLAMVRSRRFGFPGQRPEDYAAQDPRFDLRAHLNGDLRCDGMIYGPTGRVVSRFAADFHAQWDGNQGVMHEHFRYDSGSTQDREWRLTLGNDGRIRAEADDLVGVGEGRQMGSAVNLRYRIRLPKDAGGHVLNVTDWMYLAPGGAVINRSQFRKFGIKVAELVATIHRREPALSEVAE